MRIVLQIGPKRTAQMTCSGNAYIGPIDEPRQWRDWQCDLLITTSDTLDGTEQPIYIEGVGGDIIAVLEDAVNMLKGYEQILREDFDAKS